MTTNVIPWFLNAYSLLDSTKSRGNSKAACKKDGNKATGVILYVAATFDEQVQQTDVNRERDNGEKMVNECENQKKTVKSNMNGVLMRKNTTPKFTIHYYHF